MGKLKNIEFLRIILMFGIVMLHSFMNRVWNVCKIYPDISLFQSLRECFCAANNGVDTNKIKKLEPLTLEKLTEFIKKEIK